MPRVKELRGEIGTTGEIYSLTVCSSARLDIAEAVAVEHDCEANYCDICYALGNGYAFVAAHLLQGATETPLLDTVCAFYGNPQAQTPVPEWDDWYAYFKEVARECSCGNYVLEPNDDYCDNCYGKLPTEENEEDD